MMELLHSALSMSSHLDARIREGSDVADSLMHIDPVIDSEHASVTTSSSVQSSPKPSTSSTGKDLSKSEPSYNTSPMYFDPNLPPGWTRRVTQRTMGASAGKYDVYIFSPDKKKIRSRTDLMLYLARNNLDLDPNDFDFSVRGKSRTNAKKNLIIPKSLKAESSNVISSSSTTLPLQSSSVSPLVRGDSTVDSSTADGSISLSNRPKLIVKFDFPVRRLKRSHSTKSKRKKHRGASRQQHDSPQDQHVANQIVESNYISSDQLTEGGSTPDQHLLIDDTLMIVDDGAVYSNDEDLLNNDIFM